MGRVIALSLAVFWAYAHAIAESVSIIHSYSFKGSPEPDCRVRALEARTFFLYIALRTGPIGEWIREHAT